MHVYSLKTISMTFTEYVCSFSYPTFQAHEPYCHLWPAMLYNIFPHYLINNMLFRGKKSLEYEKCVVIFSTPLSEIFIILRRI